MAYSKAKKKAKKSSPSSHMMNGKMMTDKQMATMIKKKKMAKK